MALAPCRECGHQVSTEASACPHCGAGEPAGLTAYQAEGSGARVAELLMVIGLVAVLAGLYVGFGMTAHSVGIDGQGLEALGRAHTVSCGAAFNPDWRSVACEQALSGRKLTAILLWVIGGAIMIAGVVMMPSAKRTSAAGSDGHESVQEHRADRPPSP